MAQQIDVGATVEEQADDLGAPRFGGHVQWRVAIGIPGHVQARSALEQQEHHGLVSGPGSHVQGSAEQRVRGIDVGAARHEQRDHVDMAPRQRPMQRRPGLCLLVQVRAGIDELPDQLNVATFRGLDERRQGGRGRCRQSCRPED